MKASIKRKWVAALRSGEYKKTVKQLRDKRGFCCLDVLCNLHAQEHPKIAAKQLVPNEYMGSEAFLPAEVMKWAGLDKNYGAEVVVGDDRFTLPEVNDEGVRGKRLNFPRIADLIEAQL